MVVFFVPKLIAVQERWTIFECLKEDKRAGSGSVGFIFCSYRCSSTCSLLTGGVSSGNRCAVFVTRVCKSRVVSESQMSQSSFMA